MVLTDREIRTLAQGQRLIEPFDEDKEMWLDAMLDYVIGDNYPNPVRCLKACEQPIKAYLNQELFSSEAQPFDIFAVEGGTAGICYLFDTLANNYLLEKG